MCNLLIIRGPIVDHCTHYTLLVYVFAFVYFHFYINSFASHELSNLFAAKVSLHIYMNLYQEINILQELCMVLMYG